MFLFSFAPFLSFLSSLHAVFTKCKESLQDGRRLENISWRLWYREMMLESQRLVFASEEGSLDEKETETMDEKDEEKKYDYEAAQTKKTTTTAPPPPPSYPSEESQSHPAANQHSYTPHLHSSSIPQIPSASGMCFYSYS